MKVVSKQTLAMIADRNCEPCRSELRDTLENKTFTVCFRAIADLAACGIFGHLGSVLGPIDSPRRSIGHHAAVAVRLGETSKFTKRYFEAMLLGYAESQAFQPLLLPVPALLIEQQGADLAKPFEKALRKSGLAADALILIHPGITSMDEAATLNAVQFAAAVHQLGVPMAAGIFDCALSEELIWSRVSPQLVFLDENQFYGAAAHQASVERMKTRIRAETDKGRRIVAQGISGLGELRVAQEVGADLAWGDFVSKVGSHPAGMIAPAAHTAIRETCPCGAGSPDLSGHLLSRLLAEIPPVTAKVTAEEVFTYFEKSPELRAVAVVDENSVPHGLISRYEMVDNMARPYRHELFGRKSCSRFMDAEPLSMDVRIDLADLTEMVVNAPPRHLISGFIVTNNGRYLGIGSVQDLMREITAMQITAAQHANPLTRLPGNVPINIHIGNLLAAKVPFCIAYCDLDNFKPYNDVFGYAMGDQIIGLTARLLDDCQDPELDFLGHVGGDDFILIFRSPDWEARCRKVLARFDQEIRTFIGPEVLDQGGYLSENRKGEKELHPIISLSIGALEIRPGAFDNHLAIASVAAEAKKKAKAIKGNSFYVNQRKYPARPA
jgi:diguanylate cyclase (GGDEF)-like protein